MLKVICASGAVVASFLYWKYRRSAADKTTAVSPTETQIELAVKMTCQSCVQTVTGVLRELHISQFNIDLDKQSVVLTSSLPAEQIANAIEDIGGLQTIVRGQGGAQNLGCAICPLLPGGVSKTGVTGVVRFVQLTEKTIIVEGSIDGLKPGKHGLHIHEYGDFSNGCLSTGDHFNPFSKNHGSPQDVDRHAGDLGNIVADAQGHASFRIADQVLKVWDIIGRAMVVHELEDDLGRGGNELSLMTGNAGARLACGIVARSAGVLENSKKVCTCDGLTLWEEKSSSSSSTGK